MDLRQRVARLLLAVAVVLAAGLLLPGLPGPVATGVEVTAYLLVVGVAVTRPLSSPVNRTLWVLVAVAVVLRAAGHLVYLAILGLQGTVTSPSVADAHWLAMCVALVLALAERARMLAPRLTLTLVLDALLAALASAGLAVALLYGTMAHVVDAGASTASVLTNLAYPVVDAALLVIVVGLLVAAGWRAAAYDWLITLAVVGFTVLDIVFLLRVSEGGFRLGPGLSALSIVSTATLVLAGWVTSSAQAVPVTERRPPGVVVPALFATLCVTSFVLVAFAPVPVEAIMFTAVGLLVAIVRAVLTVLRDRTDARSVLSDTHEELRRFRALVENSTDFIAMAGMDRRMLYVNPAGRRMVGLPPDADVSGTTIADLLTPDGQRLSAEVEQPTVLQHGRWQGQSTLRQLSGGPATPVAVSTFLMRHGDDRPFGLATVQRDLTERLDAERVVQDLAEQRQTLLDRLVQAQEDERGRIAEDVHDDSVQALAAVDLRLGLLRRTLADSAPESLAHLDELRQIVGDATDRLRHLLFDLESPATTQGLGGALREAAAFVLDDSATSWEVVGDCDADLPQAARITAYRVVKEAIVNARKHSGAAHLVVALADRDDGVEVTVTDDGSGFDPTEDHVRPGHLGLASMRDRVEIAGGRLEVRSSPGQGTVVSLWLPAAREGLRAGRARPSRPAPPG